MNKISGNFLKWISVVVVGFMVMLSCEPTPNSANPFDAKEVRANMMAAFDWQQQNPKWPLYDWTNGAYHIGIASAWKTTKNPKYFDALIQTGDSNNWVPGKRWYHADDLAIALTYTDVYDSLQDPSLLTGLVDNLDTLMANPQWTLDPKREFEHHAIVQLWWWCDALFMGPTVFTRYAQISGEEKYFNFSDSLYHQAYDLLYSKEYRLFTRDLKYKWTGSVEDKKASNGKPIFWSRGNGWVIAGLTFILEDLPENHPKRLFYEQLYLEMATSIRDLQPADGLWRPSLLDQKELHGEMSGTSFFIYSLAWGVNSGYLRKDDFIPAIRKGWTAMLACQNNDGMVGWVQQIGQSPKPVSDKSWEVFGTGAFLMAGSEILKLE